MFNVDFQKSSVKFYRKIKYDEWLTLIIRGRGRIEPCKAKISKKCLCSHYYNAALIKQIFRFDTV